MQPLRVEKGKLLEELKERLDLRKIPKKIEAFDISNIQGKYAVGSMVVFREGEPWKEEYRHFKIKTVEGTDDYGMMYEVLLRRYQRAVEGNDLPDLVLVDGGRGQLNVVQEVFKELGIKGVDLLSLAKARRGGARRLHTEKPGEKVFHPRHKEPIVLGKQSPLLRFLDRIRDEAHRFAITYHKKVRKRGTIRSVLEEIPGIGKVRQRELLRFFGSAEKIKEATVEELSKALKMNYKLARKIHQFFYP